LISEKIIALPKGPTFSGVYTDPQPGARVCFCPFAPQWAHRPPHDSVRYGVSPPVGRPRGGDSFKVSELDSWFETPSFPPYKVPVPVCCLPLVDVASSPRKGPANDPVNHGSPRFLLPASPICQLDVQLARLALFNKTRCGTTSQSPLFRNQAPPASGRMGPPDRSNTLEIPLPPPQQPPLRPTLLPEPF